MDLILVLYCLFFNNANVKKGNPTNTYLRIFLKSAQIKEVKHPSSANKKCISSISEIIISRYFCFDKAFSIFFVFFLTYF